MAAEAKHINKSLTFLEQMVVALGDRRRTHVPFRNSKLTHVLHDSLGGNCMTQMIANVWGDLEQLSVRVRRGGVAGRRCGGQTVCCAGRVGSLFADDLQQPHNQTPALLRGLTHQLCALLGSTSALQVVEVSTTPIVHTCQHPDPTLGSVHFRLSNQAAAGHVSWCVIVSMETQDCRCTGAAL